jgi:thiosulfate/3-mercaptopyruvate sulfurtransferase
VDTIRNDENYYLIDSRTAARYRGEIEPIDPIAGHIPGAISAPFPENLDENGYFLSKEKLRERFENLKGKISSDKIVFYCGSGVTACHNLLAYEHAGLGRAKLFVGSWSGWIANGKREIA